MKQLEFQSVDCCSAVRGALQWIVVDELANKMSRLGVVIGLLQRQTHTGRSSVELIVPELMP